jgi:hypothetical protein
MKIEDMLILGGAGLVALMLVKFVKGGTLPFGASMGKTSMNAAALTASNSYGMANVTDVERPYFAAAGLGSFPTMEQQMAYYYKDGM